MKKVLYLIEVVLIVLLCLVGLTGCKKAGEKNESNKEASEVQTYEWPAESLSGYDVPAVDFGKITDINEVKNEGFDFNYTMEIKDAKKSDLDKYCKKFEGWSKYETDSAYFLTKSEPNRKSSVVISYDEDDSTARVVITVSNPNE